MVTYRPALADEVGAAIEVWRQANATALPSQHPDRMITWAQSPGALTAVAADPAGWLIAMGMALPGRADDGAGILVPDLAHLTGVCVVPHAQGVGVGSQLLDYLLGELKARGYGRVTLWTHGDNQRAQRLFTARGFRPTGRLSRDDVGEQLLHYEADLPTGQ